MMSRCRDNHVKEGPSFVERTRPDDPTPGRRAKPSFAESHPSRSVTTVEALYNSGAITDSEVSAASRMRRDWLYARHGYVEADRPLQGIALLKHDVLSWRITRAQTGLTLKDLQYAVKQPVFELLELMLIHEVSFTGMARALLPTYSDTVARGRISAQCVLALRTLAAAYDDLDHARRLKRIRAK